MDVPITFEWGSVCINFWKWIYKLVSMNILMTITGYQIANFFKKIGVYYNFTALYAPIYQNAS